MSGTELAFSIVFVVAVFALLYAFFVGRRMKLEVQRLRSQNGPKTFWAPGQKESAS
jgi:hypothetical protein